VGIFPAGQLRIFARYEQKKIGNGPLYFSSQLFSGKLKLDQLA
jgi:hypothetical protein